MSSPPQPPTATTTTSPPQQPQPPLPRKFPAPCWTQEETLALIRSYQDKWYSLRRRNLRTADWEAVATDVSQRCPDQSPAKTSAQCRHKMEKLRKRYRTEKQRFLSLPHNPHHNSRYFSPSSWIFFDLMDAMEIGSNQQPPQQPPLQMPPSGIPLVHLKPDLVQNHKPLVFNKTKEEFGRFYDDILMNINPNPNPSAHVSVNANSNSNIKFKVKHPHLINNFDDSNHDDEEDYYESMRNSSIRGGSSKRKASAQDYDDFNDPSPSRKAQNNNGGAAASRSGSGSRDLVAEMVGSIKMLGEGLIKMEKMKMDMMREIETMRMEMELKRSEMILESQQLIVNAFVQGLKKNNHSSNNNKVVKVMEIE